MLTTSGKVVAAAAVLSISGDQGVLRVSDLLQRLVPRRRLLGIQGATIWATAVDTLGNSSTSATQRLP